MRNVGTVAPDFTLDGTGGTFSLAALRGQNNVLLIFYPRDNTPG